ncbi:PASTA domain-containing protein [bacterium]|nr:PASTA domain-containing protein [bacterium]
MKKILIHLGLIILTIAVLIFITLRILRVYTKHDEELIEVPELLGEQSRDAISTLEELGLRYEVMDTVYKDGERKLSVINQDPAPGLQVKSGRRVYLVINSDKIPMVEVPDLAGKTSLNQAKSILSRLGLKMGKIIERPSDMVRSTANKPVLGQRIHGDSTELQPGGLIERNSKIDLIIGVPKNQSDTTDFTDEPIEGEEPIELF